MAFNLDTYLGVHSDALKLQSKRMEVIADNLANADTPGYKARDIDFRAAMAQAGGTESPVSLTTTNAGHIAADPATALNANLKYRVPLAPRSALRSRAQARLATSPSHAYHALAARNGRTPRHCTRRTRQRSTQASL